MKEKTKEIWKGIGCTVSAGIMLGVGVAATVVEGPMGKLCNSLGRKSPMSEQMESASTMWEQAKEHFEEAGRY